MAKPKSHTLFHFTRSRDSLERILISGFWPRYCLEDISWMGDDDYQQIAFPMVCFCDIPLSRIEDHVNFYGSFGLGMSKDWAIKNDLNPVLYMAGQNELAKSILKIAESSDELVAEVGSKIKISLRRLASHIKQLEGTMVVKGKLVEKEFYQESEWRYTPSTEGVPDHAGLKQFNSDEKREKLNQHTAELCMLKFLPGDVKYIFVPADSDIPAIINFIQTQLDHFPGADLKVLLSRVISLETVKRDF